MRTHTVKAKDITESWHLVDAENKPLGRVAAEIAKVLRGKHRPEYSPHLSLGDHVVVVNADKVYLSGRKREQRVYYRYSGYPGGLRVRSLGDIAGREPEKLVRQAVRGMLPSNRLGRRLLKKLKVYAGPSHPHAAQKPQELKVS